MAESLQGIIQCIHSLLSGNICNHSPKMLLLLFKSGQLYASTIHVSYGSIAQWYKGTDCSVLGPLSLSLGFHVFGFWKRCSQTLVRFSVTNKKMELVLLIEKIVPQIFFFLISHTHNHLEKHQIIQTKQNESKVIHTFVTYFGVCSFRSSDVPICL